MFSRSSGEKRKNLLPAETLKKLKRCPAGAASVAHLRGSVKLQLAAGEMRDCSCGRMQQNC